MFLSMLKTIVEFLLKEISSLKADLFELVSANNSVAFTV